MGVEPLFFVLSLVGVIFVRDGGFRIMFLVLLASIFMQPGKYMGFGRYVSQVYMIPLVVMLGVLSRKASSSRWVPWALAVLAIGYALPQMPKKLLPYPYMWLISVQNLQVVGAVQNDAKPIVSTANYSAAVSWLCDNKPGVEIIHESERVQDHLSFGPCTGRYHYLAKDPIVDFRDYACVAVTDSNTIVDKSFSAKRHAGIEKYFVKEFLPKELPLIPVRLWQTACYRFRQLFRHWS